MKSGKTVFLFFLISFSVAIFYFITRLTNLTAIPVFGDEAIYLRWSQIIKNVETLRFIPLTDGKEPLFMWLTVPMIKIFHDPLVSGRLLSVLIGFGTICCLYLTMLLISKRLFLSFIPPIIYVFTPFAFFFDRMSLADGLLSFFGILSLLLSIILIKYPRNDIAMVLGIVLGLAWLTKSPAIYFIVLTFFSFVLFHWKQPKLIYLPLISAIFAFTIYNILRLGPQFHMIAIRNKDYVWPLSEILKHPLDPLRPHLVDVVKIFTQYIGPTLLFIFPTIKLLKSKEYRLYILILLAWFILPTISNASIAKAFTSRYILFTLPAGIILISLGIGQFKYKYKYLLLALLLIPNIIYIYQISVRPFYAKLPSTELGYIEDWTSGWGISQSADYLIKRSKEANVIVGTEGNFGTLPDGLQIYTDGVEHLTVIGVGLEFHTLPANLVNARKYGDEVYLLMNKSRLLLSPEEVDKLTLVQTYEKPKNDKLLLYRFN